MGGYEEDGQHGQWQTGAGRTEGANDLDDLRHATIFLGWRPVR